MAPPRIAVIGCGLIGRTHAARVAAEPRCRLAALVDPAPATAALAAEYGVPHHAHWDTLEGADAAIVATPNALHVPAALACIARGLPVLVEKPVAETVEGAQRIVEAAGAAGVQVLVGHHRRHNPLIARARALIAEGRLGRLVAVACLWMLRKPEPYFDTAWRREAGGGPVLINLIHDLDLLRHLCGEIAGVQAFSSAALRGFPVEDTAAVLLRFAGGALGTATVSDAAVSPWAWELTAGENAAFPRQDESCYLLTGTAASLALPNLALWRNDGAAGWQAPLLRERIPVPPGEALVLQLRHFCDVIEGRAEPLVSAADAARSLAAALAVHEAAATGREVALG